MQNIWLQAFQRSHKNLGAPACRQGDARVVMLTQVSCTSICRNASSPHITAKLKMIIPHHSNHILHHSASFCIILRIGCSPAIQISSRLWREAFEISTMLRCFEFNQGTQDDLLQDQAYRTPFVQHICHVLRNR